MKSGFTLGVLRIIETNEIVVDFLSASGDTYEISVDIPEEAGIPKGAELHVSEISDFATNEAGEKYVDIAAETLELGEEEVKYVKLLDIYITKDGEKVQPKVPVFVKIKLLDKDTVEATEETDEEDTDGDDADITMQVVHFGENETAKLDCEENEEELSFDTDGFSVFAIVGTETIETTYLTADGETYKITVNYTKEAEIPEGSELEVREILSGTEEYNTYLKQALDAATPEADVSDEAITTEDEDSDIPEDVEGLTLVHNGEVVDSDELATVDFQARFFDITIIKNGEKIEPKDTVQVVITYADSIEVDESSEVKAIHFAEDGVEVIDTTTSSDNKEVTFSQDSFSVTGTVVAYKTTNYSYYVIIRTGSSNDYTYYAVDSSGNRTEVSLSGTSGEISITNVNDASATIPSITANSGNNGGMSIGSYTYTTYNNNYHYLSYSGYGYGATTYYLSSTGGRTTSTTERAYVILVRTKDSDYMAHATGHIDIGVTASASVKVPLAYGNYYDEDGNLIKSVALNEHVNAVGVNPQVPINREDLQDSSKTTISAFTYNDDGTTTPFTSFTYGTSYSSDDGYDPYTGNKIDQVRIGGYFPVGSITSSHTGSSTSSDVEQYITEDNQVYYSVQVVKEVELTLTYEDENGVSHVLYDADGNKLTVNVPTALVATFSFWDNRNGCPGVLVDGHGPNYTAAFLNGGGAGTGDRQGGMDFILGTSDDQDASISAIEIIKYTVNTDGQIINVSTEDAASFNFNVYQNTNAEPTVPTAWSGATEADVDYSGYTLVDDRSVSVGSAGYAVAYDYSVADNALVYIEETNNLANTTITDTDGNTWDYVETYIETEYVWRDDNGATHSNIKKTGSDRMKSIPDVVGDYYYIDADGNRITTSYNPRTGQDEQLHNTFLEFYVYNVYKGGEVEFKKVDQSGYMIEGATFELYLTDPSTDASAITAYRATSARNTETGLVEVDFGSVAYGTYYMMETDAPEGYVKDTNVYRVDVFEGESGAESCKIERKTDDGWVELSKQNNLYVFPNTPKYVNDFNITKVDENGSQVNGATLKFERLVTTETGDKYVDYDFDTSTSGNQSTITVGTQDISLGTGKYRIRETDVPTGYEGTFEYIYLTVNGENATITLTDASGNAIEGVVDPDDTTKTTYTITNDDNLAIITMEETTTTSEEDDGTIVTSHSYKLQVVNKSTSRNVKIRKVDNSETPIPLKDAKFSMAIDGTTYVFTSNEDGYLVFSGKIVDGTEVALSEDDPSGVLTSLQTGSYVMSETDPPAGYIMLEGRIGISVGATVTADNGTVNAYDADDNEIEEGDTETEVAYYVISITNAPGQALPNTGGPGTLIYTLSGLILITGSVIGLSMRRRERRCN